jgi:uncharacterized membrane protein YtjA (UPF0391 family)
MALAKRPAIRRAAPFHRYGEIRMIKWALIFAVISVIAGILGFTGVAAGAAAIAKVLFAVFLIIFLVLLVLGLTVFRAVEDR